MPWEGILAGSWMREQRRGGSEACRAPIWRGNCWHWSGVIGYEVQLNKSLQPCKKTLDQQSVWKGAMSL